MVGMNRWKSVLKAFLAIFLVALLSVGVLQTPAAIAADKGRSEKSGLFRSNKSDKAKAEKGKTTSKLASSLAETPPPPVIQALRKALDDYQPQVSILTPKPNEVLTDNTVSVRFQVKDLPIFKNEKLGLGPHLHVFLDNHPYQAVYDLSKPLVLNNLEPGTHTLRVFASRPWHESFKNEGAYTQVSFHVFTKTQENSPNPDLPLLTYSRPQASYGAEPIMLDFYLTNAPLHLVAQDQDDVTDWRIRCTVNGESFVIDRWQPIYLKGFKPGKNWVQLEFLDEKGNSIKNVFNNTARVISYEPGGKDTLSRLVRGELSAADARGIVDPNYVPVEPVPTPIPTPTPIPSPSPEPSSKPTPIPTPVPVVPPGKPTPTAPPVTKVKPAPASKATPTDKAKGKITSPQIAPSPTVTPTPQTSPELKQPSSENVEALPQPARAEDTLEKAKEEKAKETPKLEIPQTLKEPKDIPETVIPKAEPKAEQALPKSVEQPQKKSEGTRKLPDFLNRFRPESKPASPAVKPTPSASRSIAPTPNSEMPETQKPIVQPSPTFTPAPKPEASKTPETIAPKEPVPIEPKEAPTKPITQPSPKQEDKSTKTPAPSLLERFRPSPQNVKPSPSPIKPSPSPVKTPVAEPEKAIAPPSDTAKSPKAESEKAIVPSTNSVKPSPSVVKPPKVEPEKAIVPPASSTQVKPSTPEPAIPPANLLNQPVSPPEVNQAAPKVIENDRKPEVSSKSSKKPTASEVYERLLRPTPNPTFSPAPAASPSSESNAPATSTAIAK